MENKPRLDEPGKYPPALLALAEELAAGRGSAGIVLVGSASRGQNDRHSDYDLQLIADDEVFRLLKTEELVETRELPSCRAEIQKTSVADFLALKRSPRDCDHWPYQSARILYDRDGLVAREIELIRAMPREVMSSRLRLHLFEFYFYANRMRALEERGDRLNLLLVCGQIAQTATALALVSRGKWPPLLHWSAQELRGERKEALALAVEKMLRSPGTPPVEELKLALLEDLCADGHEELVTDAAGMARVSSPYFRAVRESFGRL